MTIIDVAPDGSVRPAPPSPVSLRAFAWIAVAAAGTVLVLSVVLFLWLAVTLLPLLVAFGAASVLAAWMMPRRRAG